MGGGKNMQKKIIGILIMILFISSSVFPIIVESNRVNYPGSDFSNKYAWSGKGHGLDNKGVISVIVPSLYPVYLVFSTSYEIFSPDSGHVELSADGGNNWYPMDMITGVQSDWTMRSVDISSFMGMPVLIRFRYSTGSYSTSGGWYVDSISIKGDVVEDFEGYNAGDHWGDWVIIEETGNLPPSVGITFPKNGDVVNGTVIITGEAHDPNGDDELKWVMLKIGDLDWSYADGISSWSYIWDTTVVNDGSCVISAITTDGTLQSSVFTIVVTVDNVEGPGVQPDLVITDIWDENKVIYYQIRNIGDDNASSGHRINLFIENENKASDLVEEALAPGERFNSNFDYSWDCPGLEVLVSAYADYNDIVNESNETNNKRGEKWRCDTTSPKIIDGPIAQGVSQRSATIYWKTDEICDSTVSFDRYAGKYNNIVRDSKLVNVHNIVLNNLNSGTVYHFMVESMDASGNSVKSRDYYFATTQAADNKKPSLYPHLPDILSGIVDISIDASDNVGVDRVHFSCDDESIFTVYTPPHEWSFDTSGLMDGEHDFGFDAFDDSGNSASESIRGEVMNKFPPDLRPPVNVQIISPEEGEEFTLGERIHIYAKVESKNKTKLANYKITQNSYYLYGDNFSSFPCMNDIIIDEIDFRDRDNVYWVSYWWDTSDYIPMEVTRIDVYAWDVYNNEGVDNVHFKINIPPPDVQVFRDVERIDNYYQVELTIRNNGDFTLENINIFDTSVGFQCDDNVELDPPRILPPNLINIVGGTETFNEGRNSFEIGDYSQIQIDLPIDVDVPGDGGELNIWYYVVPVLFDPANGVSIEDLEWLELDSETIAVPHVIGHKLLIEYRYIGDQYLLEKDDLRWDLTSNDNHRCADDNCVSNAFRDADYLIVTSPTKLDRENAGSQDVNKLLVAIAELARLKNGVLGYTWTNDWSILHGYIKEYGDWWDKLRAEPGDDDLPRGPFDYLLLVGETEIIPSRTKGGFDDLEWIDGDKVEPVEPVEHTDKSYSNIVGDGKPDIAVGRIIGNSSSNLITPIQTSINVHNNIGGYEFDRSNVLLVSGTGNYNDTFQKDINDTYDILIDIAEHFDMYENVVKLHWVDYPGNEKNLFLANIGNRDIVLFSGHGLPDLWSPGLDINDASGLGFGSAKPFVYAIACHTGNYETGDDYNIAESFFKSLVGIYIGSTVSAPLSKGDSLQTYFFNHWDPSESIGKTFKDLKRHYYNNDDWWRYVCYEFNLYGDPKYGVMPEAALDTSLVDDLISEEIDIEEPLSYIEVEIPNYEVSFYKGFDYVEIPGGEILSSEEGRPRIPYYIRSIEYPKRCQVQNVTLSERSGLMTDMGLELPVIVNNPNIEFIEMKGDWYPHDNYNWRVEENDDESTTLVITIYPFYYNPDTTMVKFYKNYNFDIEYVNTDMEITVLYTDKDLYRPGDNVKIDLWLENSGQPQDFIANIVVKEEISEEVFDGLYIKLLKNLKGLGLYSVTWDSPYNSSDSYFIETTITDTSGNILDIIYDTIYFKTPSLTLKSITGGFGTSVVVENTGIENLTDLKWSITIDGNMVFLRGYKKGNIPIIKPGENYQIKSGLIIGFGPAEITINIAGVEKTISCFLFGPFVTNIKEI